VYASEREIGGAQAIGHPLMRATILDTLCRIIKEEEP